MKLLLLATLALAGCGTTAASLGYAPTVAPHVQTAPVVAVVVVTDARQERDPTYVGAIRNYGAPVKTLITAHPVKDEVAAAFTAALQARGLFDPTGPGVLTVTLRQLSANQVARREGHTRFEMVLSDRTSGRVLFQDSEDVLKISGSLISFDVGFFASIDDLRAVAALSLSEAIDRSLDKPGFAAAR